MTKICTDLQQSKKLLELGIEANTADMFWDTLFAKKPEAQVNNYHFIDEYYDDEHRVPAWSLTALLNIIPEPDLVQNSEGTWLVHSWVNAYPWSVGGYSNPVDATYNMIIKLHEKNLL